MSVRRGAEANAQSVIALLAPEGKAVSLAADGKPLPIRLREVANELVVAPGDVDAIIAVLRSARQLQVRSAAGKTIATISLAGASAALLYMDEQQRRLGTTTALVRRGPNPASAVPPPPALPVVTAARATSLPPIRPSASRIAALRKQHGCVIEDVGGLESDESAAIDARHTLLLISCGAGAYNASSLPVIVRRKGRSISPSVAKFDVSSSWTDGELPLLVNATWDEERGLLVTYSKGRGLGDCGVSRDYAWDGASFRLVEQSEMGECRGSYDFITTWRSRVVRR